MSRAEKRAERNLRSKVKARLRRVCPSITTLRRRIPRTRVEAIVRARILRGRMGRNTWFTNGGTR